MARVQSRAFGPNLLLHLVELYGVKDAEGTLIGAAHMGRIDKGRRKAGNNTRGASNTERVIAAEALALASPAGAQTVVPIGIGTQDTTTNTATAGTPAQSAGEIPAQGR